MSSTADRDDPALWEKVKTEITADDKGGRNGEWSARKAQLAVAEYKKRGGGYKGRKKADNALTEWTQENWGTKSGKPSGETHERYLPKAEREKLSTSEYDRTTAKKRADTKKGKQYSSQPADVAAKTNHRSGTATKRRLYQLAKTQNVAGRSKMSKAELAQAVK